MTGLRTGRAALWATGGSILSAVFASACCWLPLLLLLFGLSATGVAIAFEKVRPFFLACAALLLATGFYLNYVRKEKCDARSGCTVPNRKLRNFNRSMLWVALVAVLAFAFFPNYVGVLLSSTDPEVMDSPSKTVLTIEGMTCDACALHVQNSLESVPGVVAANVRYADRQALVSIESAAPPSHEALIKAVRDAGYDVANEPSTD